MMLPGLTTEEAKALIISVGTHHGRRLLSPVEVAKLFSKAISHGASRNQCASFVHLKGTTMISRFLRLLDLTPIVQLATDWRQTGPTISFTSAWQISGLDNDEQEKACFEIMTNQLSTKEVEQAIQLRQRSGQNFVDCAAKVVKMRPKVEKVHVILGAIIDNKVKEWLSNLNQASRDNLLSNVLSKMYPDAKNCSGRLGADKFTIVTDEKGYALINPNNDGSFETVVTHTLKKEIKS